MKQRVLTALALIPPVLAALFLRSELPIGLFAALVVLIGLSEIKRMLKGATWVYGGFLLLLIYCLPGDHMVDDGGAGAREFLIQWGVVHFVFGVLATSAVPVGKDPFWSLLAAGWVIGPMECLVALHGMHLPKTGTWFFATPVLLAIVPLWGGDTAAIFAGRAFGKHLLAERISPKKTWEGAIANLLACIAVAVPLASWIGYAWPVGAACGLAAGILGQAGDLFESWIKRKADLKDSGTLLPGHGGIMDRIDSILFTAPAVALILLNAGG